MKRRTQSPPEAGVAMRFGSGSGRLVRDQRGFETDDRVLQLQLPLLQALDGQFVGDDVFVQAGDGQIEVTVFHPQLIQPMGESGEFGGVGRLVHRSEA